MPDPTTGNNNPSQGGGLGAALGQILPNALPGVLGAALGGPMGAMAGIAAAQPSIEQQQRQGELAMQWQQLQLDQQRTQMTLSNEKATNDYIDSLPKDEQGLARLDPGGYASSKLEQKQWDLTKQTFSTDPSFAASMGADPKVLKSLLALPPKAGSVMLDNYMKTIASGKFPGGVHGPTKGPDGKWYYQGIGARGEITNIPAGEPASTVNVGITTAAAAPSKMTGDITKLTSAFKSLNGEPPSSGAMGSLEFWKDSASDYAAKLTNWYVSNGVDPEEAAAKAQAVAGLTGAASPSSKLKSKAKAAPAPGSSEALPRPPKELWGKTVELKGKKYRIDTMGKVTALN